MSISEEKKFQFPNGGQTHDPPDTILKAIIVVIK